MKYKTCLWLKEEGNGFVGQRSDYLRKISLKMLAMERNSQNPMANSLQSNAASNNKNLPDTDSRCIVVNENLGSYIERIHPRVSEDYIHGAHIDLGSRTNQYDDLIKRLKGIVLPFHPNLNPQPDYEDMVSALQDMAITLVRWNPGRD